MKVMTETRFKLKFRKNKINLSVIKKTCIGTGPLLRTVVLIKLRLFDKLII